MNTKLIDLASPLFLLLASFRRRARRDAQLVGDEIRTEMVGIFRDLDQQAQAETVLAEFWGQAKRPLIYLVDEIMTQTEWEYRGWWLDQNLESALLGNRQSMRGILFFDELEIARRSVLETSHSGDSANYPIQLLAIFYCCLRFGFQGKYSGQAGQLEALSKDLFDLLPNSIRSETRRLFEQAYEHTQAVPPQHESYMRFATVIGLAIGMVLLFVGFREYLYSDLLGELDTAAQQAGVFFNQTSEFHP